MLQFTITNFLNERLVIQKIYFLRFIYILRNIYLYNSKIIKIINHKK